MRLRRVVLQHVAVVLGFTLVAEYAMTRQRASASALLAATAVALVSVAICEVGLDTVRMAWPVAGNGQASAHNANATVGLLKERLREATRNPQVYRRRIRPLLVTIVSSRLRHAHGIDLDFEPDAARAVTGEWLWDRLTGSQDRVLTYDELTRLVDEVEGL